MSCFEQAAMSAAGESSDDEASADALQLLELANFNGVCRVIAALAENGLISPPQIRNIHDCMTAPLDDEGWRDDPFIVTTRSVLETVLACAMKDAVGAESGRLVIDE